MRIRPLSVCAFTMIALLQAGSSNCPAQTVTLINPGTDNRIAEIEGLTINGLDYDATFHYGTNFDSLPDPLTFEGNSLFDFSQSVEAAEAVASAVGTLPALPGSTAGALVPNFAINNFLTLAFIPRQANYSNWDPSDVRVAIASRGISLPSDFAWVTFQEAVAAVPEPSALFLSITLMVGVSLLRRRRTKLSHAGV
ncbi:MAG: PEP-CTERM sorting domain-containing protein [Planctomycetota bacterium]